MAPKRRGSVQKREGHKKIQRFESQISDLAQPGATVTLIGPGREEYGVATIPAEPNNFKSFRMQLHGHKVEALQKSFGKPGEVYVVIMVKEIYFKFNSHVYPYGMRGAEVPETISDLWPSGSYIWDLNRLELRSGEVVAAKAGSSVRSGSEPTPLLAVTASEQPKSSTPPDVSLQLRICRPSKASTTPTEGPASDVHSAPPVTETMNSPVKVSTRFVPSPAQDSIAGPSLGTVSIIKEDSVESEAEDSENEGSSSPIPAHRRSSSGTSSAHEPRLPGLVEDEDEMSDSNYDEDEFNTVGSPESSHIPNIPETLDRDLYKEETIKIRIDQLVLPPNKSRVKSSEHVEVLKLSLLASGLNESQGLISVARRPSHTNVTPVKFLKEKFGVECIELVDEPTENDGVFTVPAYFVVNGMHRQAAVTELFAVAKDLKQRSEFGIISVQLWSRRDGREMTFLEMLALGSRENDNNQVSLRPSFQDQVQLCISCVKEVYDMTGEREISANFLGKRFFSLNVIRATREETSRKYARIALTFVRRPNVYERFLQLWEQLPVFRISHFQSKKFHTDFDAFGQILVLDCLFAYLTQPKSNALSSTAANVFMLDCQSLVTLCRSYVERVSLCEEDVWATSVAATKTVSCSVREFVVRSMSRFNSAGDNESMKVRSHRRISTTDKALNALFFPKKKSPSLSDEAITEKPDQGKQKADEPNPNEANPDEPNPEKRNTDPVSSRKRITRQAKMDASKALAEQTARVEQNGEDDAHDLPIKLPEKREKDVKSGKFDDYVPKQPPLGTCEPKKRSPETCDWVNFMTVPEGMMNEDGCHVREVVPWLAAMGVPAGHRAYFTLTTADLEKNYVSVWEHAAQLGCLDPVVQKNPFFLETAQNHMGHVLLLSKRQELRDNGICVIKGMLNDNLIDLGDSNSVYDCNPTAQLFNFYQEKFPTVEELGRQEPHKFWQHIINKDNEYDAKAKLRGEGRFTTPRKALMEEVEQDPETVNMARYRAAIEIRILQTVHAMGLEEEGAGELRIPASGSRLLTHVGKCRRQRAHTDYAVNYEHLQPGNHFKAPADSSYSVIWTGDDPFPLIGWEQSHKLQYGPPELVQHLSSSLPAGRVMIPPYSFAIFRQDYYHSGPGDVDVTKMEREDQVNELLIRGHLYVVREKCIRKARKDREPKPPTLPDAVFGDKRFAARVNGCSSWLL